MERYEGDQSLGFTHEQIQAQRAMPLFKELAAYFSKMTESEKRFYMICGNHFRLSGRLPTSRAQGWAQEMLDKYKTTSTEIITNGERTEEA